LSIKVN